MAEKVYCNIVCIHIINNLEKTRASQQSIDSKTASSLADLIRENMLFSNSENSYDARSMERLLGNKTGETIQEILKEGLLIYLTTSTGKIAGCGMVVKQDGRYFAKTLHIHKDFRGKGLASLICTLREKAVLNNPAGADEIFIESLLFPSTIAFHKKRGFKEITPYRPLKYSILMKKKLGN